jgi:hypothetical protein
MLPVGVAGTVGGAVVDVLIAIDILIAVADKIVVVINGDVIVPSPPAVPTPTASPCCAHGYSDTERDCHSRSVVTWRWISDRGVRINRRAIHYGGIVAGNIYDLRTCLLNDDYLFVFHYLVFYLLLLARF